MRACMRMYIRTFARACVHVGVGAHMHVRVYAVERSWSLPAGALKQAIPDMAKTFFSLVAIGGELENARLRRSRVI